MYKPFRCRTRRLITGLSVVTMMATLGVVQVPAVAAAVPDTDWATLASDSFSRSISNGWGSADRGGSYTTNAAVASGDASVVSGRGTYAEVAPGTAAESFLADSPARDVLVEDTVTVPAAGDAPANLYHALWARRLADGSGYRGRLHVGPGGPSVSLERVDGHSGTLLSDVVLPTSVSAGDRVVLKLEVVQNDPVKLWAKAWKVGTAEPGWQTSYSDTSTARINSAGAVGTWNYISRSAAATTLDVDDFRAFTADSDLIASKPVPSAGSGFVHPGVLLGRSQLDFVRAQVAAGAEPWKSQLRTLQRSQTSLGSDPGTKFSSLDYVARPVAVVQCGAGPASSAPQSCVDEKNDAIAAYADALTWYYTGDEAYAQKAIQILNAWSGKLRQHTGSNAPLQASWAGSVFPRAAEIIRYTYTPDAGQGKLDVQQMKDMLTSAFLPLVNQTMSFGGANWLMSMTEATLNIAIFTDNRDAFNDAIARWRAQVPATIYLSSDRPSSFPNLSAGSPIPPPGVAWVNSDMTSERLNHYWYNPAKYVSGLQGETCRDVAHAAMGLGAMVNVAETARLQGIDLYGEQRKRIAAGIEANAGWTLSSLGSAGLNGWVCPSAPNAAANQTWKVTYEVAFNEFAHRLGVPMPNTQTVLTQFSRPSGYKADFGFAFEALTNAGTP